VTVHIAFLDALLKTDAIPVICQLLTDVEACHVTCDGLALKTPVWDIVHECTSQRQEGQLVSNVAICATVDIGTWIFPKYPTIALRLQPDIHVVRQSAYTTGFSLSAIVGFRLVLGCCDWQNAENT
jgi:hypothetical protein